jgi:hypothetical protein
LTDRDGDEAAPVFASSASPSFSRFSVRSDETAVAGLNPEIAADETCILNPSLCVDRRADQTRMPNRPAHTF